MYMKILVSMVLYSFGLANGVAIMRANLEELLGRLARLMMQNLGTKFVLTRLVDTKDHFL